MKMFTRSSTLQAFVQPALTASQIDPLATVLKLLSQDQGEQVVIVTEQYTPVGIIDRQGIIFYLMTHQETQWPHLPTPTPDFGSGFGCSVNLQQPLWATGPPLLQPLHTVRADLEVKEFLAQLSNLPHQVILDNFQEPSFQKSAPLMRLNWAIIDEQGQLLGLLDHQRLLQYLADQLAAKTHQLEWVESTERPANEHQPAFHTLNSLIELLEQLPLPLCLQTHDGEFLTGNPAWRQQISQTLEFHWTEWPQHLGSTLDLQVGGQPSPKHTADSQPIDAALTQSLGVCFIPSDQDKEKVWQFIKIPLKNFELPASLLDRDISLNLTSDSPPSSDLWLILAQDVTEHHQVAKELAAKNADLIQLNRLKDEFLACISHELKTPLTAVLGLASLLKDQSVGPMNSRQVRYARLIHQSGRHLMTVVNNILDLTRLETGQMELTLEPVSISTVCERAVRQAWHLQSDEEQDPDKESLHPSIPLSGPQLSFADEPSLAAFFSLNIEPGLEILIADELRLRQMLVHLLSNAFKFTEANQPIGLNVSQWEGWIALTVWDTGIGIPEEKQHLIFQKFQQLETPLTRRFDGTGLGLVLTQRLARAHGGDVTFTSKEGEGSQFTLLLPPCPPQLLESTKGVGYTLTPPPATRTRLVLIVEAVPRFIDDLNQQLTDLGYRVVIARAGTEALEKARRLNPEVIFLNPVMPLLSGWDVLTLLKSNPVTKHIPVIMTATQADKELAAQNRAEGFLSLPVQSMALRQRLINLGTPPKKTLPQLTVLRLSTSYDSSASSASSHLSSDLCKLMAEFNTQAHQHHYRVLEADDLEQGELLARVWSPDVILLEPIGRFCDPVAYFQAYTQQPKLASIPLITLEQTTSWVAEEQGLRVFPWLNPNEETAPNQAFLSLLQLIQVAAGQSWTPTVLVVDVAMIQEFSHSSELIDTPSEGTPALLQYLQKAGFRAITSRLWADVLRHCTHQSVDLVLLCLHEVASESVLIKALNTLLSLPAKPPVVVSDQRTTPPSEPVSDSPVLHPLSEVTEALGISTLNLQAMDAAQTTQSQSPLDSLLAKVATAVLPSEIPMATLLTHLKQILTNPNDL
jgi:signal transduction histidine kinase/CheY-like chemotaxis protein/PAS domain-containing protein